jgi:hypothetical protein
MMKEKLKEHIYSSSSDVKKDEAITEFIKIIVSDHYGFGVSDLLIKTRKRKNVMCRHVCMYLIYKNTGLSLTKVGQHFQKDHTTVVHSIKVITDLMFWDKKLNTEVVSFTKTIHSKINSLKLDLHDDFYYVDMNDVHSIKFDENKSICFSGFSEEDIYKLKQHIVNFNMFSNQLIEQKKHTNTGLYILEKRKVNELQKKG